MKEIKYFSKNDKGYSVDDIKIKDLPKDMTVVFQFSVKEKSKTKTFTVNILNQLLVNGETVYDMIIKENGITVYNPGKVSSATHQEKKLSAIENLRYLIKDGMKRLGFTDGIEEVKAKKEIRDIKTKTLNLTEIPEMKIPLKSTLHEIYLFVVIDKAQNQIIQCEGIPDQYAQVQLQSIGYNKVEDYRKKLNRYISYEGEAKDLVDEFGDWKIEIREMTITVGDDTTKKSNI